MTVPIGPRVVRDVHAALLAEIAPNAARLKAAYASHLGRALLVAVNLHLLAVGAYWALSVATFDAPAAPEPTGVVWRPIEVMPPPPPGIDPAPAPPRGGPPTQATSGVVTLVPESEADPAATTATQAELAVSTIGPRTGTANAGDGGPDESGTALPARPAPPETSTTVPPVPQPREEAPVETAPPAFYEGVEVSPELVGGLAGLQARVEYPRFDREARNEGTVVVRFVVDETGVPTQVEAVRSVSAGLDRAAVDAVRAARFTPGVQNGRVVKVRMTLPVRFTLR